VIQFIFMKQFDSKSLPP